MGTMKGSLEAKMEFGKILMIFGVMLFLTGAVIFLGGRFDFLGHLPGDLHFKTGSTEVYFPIVTCALVSVIGTVLLNLFFRK